MVKRLYTFSLESTNVLEMVNYLDKGLTRSALIDSLILEWVNKKKEEENKDESL